MVFPSPISVNIDSTTPSGRMVFSIFAALSEFERELNRERTIAGLQAARARGRKFQLIKAQVRLAQASMKKRDTSVAELCKELGITALLSIDMLHLMEN